MAEGGGKQDLCSNSRQKLTRRYQELVPEAWTSLTPAGWEVEKATRPVMLARHEWLMASLSPEQRAMVRPLIDPLYQTIAAENAASGET